MSNKNLELENLEAEAAGKEPSDARQAQEPEGGTEKAQETDSMAAIHRVPVNVQIVLGATKMPVAQVLRLSRGAVVEVDKRVGEPVDIMVNDRIVARGDLVVVEDNRIGVTLTEIVKDNSVGE